MHDYSLPLSFHSADTIKFQLAPRERLWPPPVWLQFLFSHLCDRLIFASPTTLHLSIGRTMLYLLHYTQQDALLKWDLLLVVVSHSNLDWNLHLKCWLESLAASHLCTLKLWCFNTIHIAQQFRLTPLFLLCCWYWAARWNHLSALHIGSYEKQFRLFLALKYIYPLNFKEILTKIPVMQELVS